MFSNIAIKLRALQEMFSKIADTLLGHHGCTGCTRRQGCKHSSMASADSLRKSFTYRRWTPWALPLTTYQEKFSIHTRFCPQAQPTRACCEDLADFRFQISECACLSQGVSEVMHLPSGACQRQRSSELQAVQHCQCSKQAVQHCR